MIGIYCNRGVQLFDFEIECIVLDMLYGSRIQISRSRDLVLPAQYQGIYIISSNKSVQS